MNKTLKPLKVFEKTRSINAIKINSFQRNGTNNDAMLSHEETKGIFVIHKSSEGHYNKKLTMKTNKNRQNPKIT